LWPELPWLSVNSSAPAILASDLQRRAAGEAMIREANDLLCQSWNEPMSELGER
jgi:hypothetical protein